MSLPQLDRKRGENGLVSCLSQAAASPGYVGMACPRQAPRWPEADRRAVLRADVPARFATRRESRRGGSAGCGGLPAALPGGAAVSGLDRWSSPMNPIERAIRRGDPAQQRHNAAAFGVGVIKKYRDDNGGVLAATP